MGLPCRCGSGLASYWLYDGQGIELCRACDECEKQQLAKYRPEVLGGYDQSDVDEPIEED
jgi:hypothetical protein